jgi:hypothetical protein
MDDAHFDRLAAALAAAPSRRGLLRLSSAGIVPALFGRLDSHEGAARKRRKKKCKGNKKKCGKRCIPRANCCTSDECPQGEVCRNGRCSDCATADDCPNAPACAEAVCDVGRCITTHLPVGAHCSTNQFCIANETCDGVGGCQGGSPRDCDDGFACTDDSCDEFINECVHEANDNLCATDNPCRVGRCDPAHNDSDANGCVFDPIDAGILTCGMGACQRTVPRCADGEEQECVPGQPSAEICNGIDDDCDGMIDDGAFCDIDSPATCGRTGVCAGGSCQLYGTQTVCRFASCVGETKQFEARCDGSGSCPPSQTQHCAPYRCQSNGLDCIGPGGCGGPDDCVSDHFCQGGLCVPRRGLGEACTQSNQCLSNHCATGVCCSTRCDEIGQTCDEAGQCHG